MKKLKKILFFAFIVYIGFTFFQQQVALEKLNNRYRDLKNKEAAVMKENKYLNELLHQINSESFIENEARQKLGLVKKGEIIYVDISKTKTQETKKVISKIYLEIFCILIYNELINKILRGRIFIYMPFEVGDVVEGTVLNITDFGAFIQLPEGKTGLVHISEVANTYVKDIREHLKEHDKVKVKILSMDANGRISLSIKKALPKKNNNKEGDPKDFVWQSSRNYNTNSSFEERLLKFLKDSDEKQQQLRKNFDSKRRNTGYRRSNGY